MDLQLNCFGKIQIEDLSEKNYEKILNCSGRQFITIIGFSVKEINIFQFLKSNLIILVGKSIIQDIPISLLCEMSPVENKGDYVFVNFPFEFFFKDKIFSFLIKNYEYELKLEIDKNNLDFPVFMYYNIWNFTYTDYDKIYGLKIPMPINILLDSKRKHILDGIYKLDNVYSNLNGLLIESKDKITNVKIKIKIKINYVNIMLNEEIFEFDEYILDKFYKNYNNNNNLLYLDFGIDQNNIKEFINHSSNVIIKNPCNLEIQCTPSEYIIYPIYGNIVKFSNNMASFHFTHDY